MSESANTWETHGYAAWRRISDVLTMILRVYAGCFFGSSLVAGALILGATAWMPYSALHGVLAVGSAIATAYGLGLVSATASPTVFGYSALFVGLGAGSSFARPAASLALATLGGAASTVVTSGMRGFLLRAGLPSLSLPFVLIYLCAISIGRMVGADWTLATPAIVPSELAFLPGWARQFLETLGAILFVPRLEAGLMVFVALCVMRWHAPVLAFVALGVMMLVDRGLSLSPLLRSAALVNAVFASLGLGIAWYAPGPGSYVRAASGAFFSILLTVALAEPLGRILLVPLSLPFNLSVFSVLLIDQQRPSEDSLGTVCPAAVVREPAQAADRKDL